MARNQPEFSIEQCIQEWQRRLIDLSRRNRLLYFRRSRSSNLIVLEPEAQDVFNRLVIQENPWEFWLPPLEDESSRSRRRNEIRCDVANRSDLERILKNLYRRSNAYYQERGVRILYVAFGMLHWQEMDTPTSDIISSPLILYPVKLTRESTSEPLLLSPAEEGPVLNPALQVRLQRDFRIQLPGIPEEFEQLSISDYLTSISSRLRRLRWNVEPTVIIGLFSFYRLVMYQDLEVNSNLVQENQIIRALCGRQTTDNFRSDLPNERELDSAENPEETFQIFDADSSQRVVIQAALRGQNFVIQGPPGTGKSQTIANIIAEFIAGGKKVLFVSEKMAALEVVYRRLRERSLGDFCLELHSHNADRRKVVSELKRCLDERLRPNRFPAPEEFERLRRCRQELNDYVNSLHCVRPPLERSVFDVLGTLAQFNDVPDIPIDNLQNVDRISPQIIRSWEEIIGRLTIVWRVVEEGNNFPWLGCREETFTPRVRSDLIQLLERLINALDQLNTLSDDYASTLGVDIPLYLSDVRWLIQVGDFIPQSPNPEPTWLTSNELDNLFQEAAQYHELSSEYWESKRKLESHYQESFFQLPQPQEMTDTLRESLIRLSNSTPSIDIQGPAFLEQRQRILQFLRDAQSICNTCLLDVAEIGHQIGLTVEDPSIERIQEIAELTLLCDSDAKPERHWFDSNFLQEVQAFLENDRSQYERYNRIRRDLLSRYDESFFQLDLDGLIERYNSIIYRSPLRWLHKRFYRDKSDILRTTRTGRIPHSIRQDLGQARELCRLQRQLDLDKDRVGNLLGRYFQGYNTNFDSVERAYKTVKETIRLARISPLPTELIDILSLETVVPQGLLATAKRLLDSIYKLEQNAKEMENLISWDHLRNETLSHIEQWTHDLLVPLQEICHSVDIVLSHRQTTPSNGINTLLSDLEANRRLQSIKDCINSESNTLQQRFGRRYRGIDTDWNDIQNVLQWTKALRGLFGIRSVSGRFVEIVSQATQIPSVDNLKVSYEEMVGDLPKLEEKFELSNASHIRLLRELSFDQIRERLHTSRERIDDLQIWIDFRNYRQQISEAGFQGFLERLEENPPVASQLIRIFHRAIYQAWLDNIFENNPHLRDFRGQYHQRLINEFREIDRRLVELSRYQVIELCNRRRPEFIRMQSDSEIGVLLQQANRRRGGLQLRTLFRRIPNLLPQLKPCLLMSPISVSQYLPPDLLKFDLVIFDEASQIRTEDAVVAIYRGKQLIVAGDNRQLPPTAFFQEGIVEEYDSDDEDDEEFAIFESIIDECEAIQFPRFPLRWHYRSRHESLIAYSNRHFYEDRLVTFPSSIQEHETLGIQFVHVPDGVYDRGGKRDNRREAEEVANLVFQHFERYPNKTLGIVAFSQAQMTAIEDEIELRRREHPEFEQFFTEDRLEGFFVRNLENVQGDERDIIILSVGYGYDYHRRITMNFGPLNRPGGERRLNVAISRAREKVIVVSSIRASDIDLSVTQSAGVLHLHRYLDYAERGIVALELTHPLGQGEYESPFEEDVANEIRRLGYNILPQVGCSGYRIDLGIIDPVEPGRFLLGVECDGAMYHSAATARDRDRLRQEVLERLGWRIYRIWSPDWIYRRDAEIRRLREAIEEARRSLGRWNQSSNTGSNPNGSNNTPEHSNENSNVDIQRARVQHISREELLPGTIPYRVHSLRLRVRANSSDFHLPEYYQERDRLLAELAREEGPIHIELATRRLYTAWGLTRSGSRIENAIKKSINRCEGNGIIRRQGRFLWWAEHSSKLSDVQVRVPVDNVPESFRSIEHIPPEEIQRAICLIIRHGFGWNGSVDSLLIETARLLGFNRINDRIQRRIRRSYEMILQRGIIIQTGDSITLGDSDV